MANKPQENLEFYTGYGAHFKTLRTNAGLTQIQLAEIIPISDKTISQIESEQRKPTIGQIKVYHDYFNASFEYLTGESSISNVTEQYISDYTGLSEKAIAHLKYLSSNNVVFTDNNNKAFYLPNNKIYLRIQAINKLLESEQFAQLIDNLVYIERLTSDIIPCESDNHVQWSKNNKLSESADICRYNVFKTSERISNMYDRRESNG